MIKNLKALREKHGISQQKLAVAIGVSQQSINKYENHNIEPDIDTLIAIADYFGTSVDYLIGRTDDTSYRGITPEENAFLAKYRCLTLKEKESIKLIIENYSK